MSGGGVPNIRWSEARVQLRLSFRHQAEFQRRADGRGLMFAKLLQILFQLRICMGTADNHQRRARIADLNQLAHTALFFPGLAFCRAVHYVHYRRIHHT
ncbi:hypothetical protein DP20_3220 [Shigella flexneri]|nr:hypothetical protein DP20_3220 [Shigella flexneri]